MEETGLGGRALRRPRLVQVVQGSTAAAGSTDEEGKRRAQGVIPRARQTRRTLPWTPAGRSFLDNVRAQRAITGLPRAERVAEFESEA